MPLSAPKNKPRLPSSMPSRVDKSMSLDNIVEEMIAEDEASKSTALLSDDSGAQEDAPVVMLVFALLKEAIRRRASDVHVEPEEDALRIRFRIDGALQQVQRLPVRLAPIVVSRLKIMGKLDITERRMPQDGTIRLRTPEGEDADFRMSTLPSVFGEKIVLRVMSKNTLTKELDAIGLPEKELKAVRSAVNKPDGLILVTGPTGSGKTTTLYAGLAELNSPDRSIFTAEDPVEGTIKGTTQAQVNPGVGYTFATVLRSLLRQDPDIILIGEIRDKETIDIAIKASLTGHLVLSSLHTNDAAATVQRLLNMGVEPYLIASSLNLIVAQRLVRKICDTCREAAGIDPVILERLGLKAAELDNVATFKGKGCKECGKTGYKGRTAIYEVMVVNDRLKEMILRGASQLEVKHMARKQGMTTLREAGINLIKEGITTLEEVLAKTNEDEDGDWFGDDPHAPAPDVRQAEGYLADNTANSTAEEPVKTPLKSASDTADQVPSTAGAFNREDAQLLGGAVQEVEASQERLAKLEGLFRNGEN